MGQQAAPQANTSETVSRILDDQKTWISLLGDAKHRYDVYLNLREYGTEIDNTYLSASAQARYLKANRPDLVPPRQPNGTEPSDHTVSQVFEFQYETSPLFRSTYLVWLQIPGLQRRL